MEGRFNYDIAISLCGTTHPNGQCWKVKRSKGMLQFCNVCLYLRSVEKRRNTRIEGWWLVSLDTLFPSGCHCELFELVNLLHHNNYGPVVAPVVPYFVLVWNLVRDSFLFLHSHFSTQQVKHRKWDSTITSWCITTRKRWLGHFGRKKPCLLFSTAAELLKTLLLMLSIEWWQNNNFRKIFS